jgi:3-hydroxybutyryl-CoA dehydrogenase
MQIVVKADARQKEIFAGKNIPPEVVILWQDEDKDIPVADAYFDLCYEEKGQPAFSKITHKPVFVNAVAVTCAALPAGSIRINAWEPFFQRDILEIAAADNDALDHGKIILTKLNWKYQVSPDAPGMIAARVIAMVINEAYFALGDDISSKKEIDTAMKLGTNYPYGPFEWSEKIGLQKVYDLLQTLGMENIRYAIAPALQHELENRKPINP